MANAGRQVDAADVQYLQHDWSISVPSSVFSGWRAALRGPPRRGSAGPCSLASSSALQRSVAGEGTTVIASWRRPAPGSPFRDPPSVTPPPPLSTSGRPHAGHPLPPCVHVARNILSQYPFSSVYCSFGAYRMERSLLPQISGPQSNVLTSMLRYPSRHILRLAALPQTEVHFNHSKKYIYTPSKDSASHFLYP